MNYAWLPAAVVLIIAPGLMLLGVLALRKRWQSWARPKRSPFSDRGLRGPAESLRLELEELESDLAFDISAVMMIPVLLYALGMTQVFATGANPYTVGIIMSLFVVISVIWQMRKVIKSIGRRTALRLGRDAEIATAEELQPLIRTGAYVFHDVPFEGFNIDHVAALPQGVFAIETKGRSKPADGGDKAHVVEFYGDRLEFPGWTDSETPVQAKRQAASLAGWLSKATGESTSVLPVIAIPGWYVQAKTAPKGLIALNPKLCLSLSRFPVRLSDGQLQRIVHQLDQKCRNVER